MESSKQYTYNKLRGRIIEKFGNQENFAKTIGLSATSLSNKMQCKTGISQKDIEVWSKPELLDINPSDYGEYFFT